MQASEKPGSATNVMHDEKRLTRFTTGRQDFAGGKNKRGPTRVCVAVAAKPHSRMGSFLLGSCVAMHIPGLTEINGARLRTRPGRR